MTIQPAAQTASPARVQHSDSAMTMAQDSLQRPTTVQVKLPAGALSVAMRPAQGRSDGAEVLGYWTDEEMSHLLAAISKVTGGTMNDTGLDWSQVASMVPSRSAKQCRQKYLNHLRPGISKEPWSLQEEYVLALMHSKIGNRWQELSRFLPSRPENTVKNHWSTTHRAKGYARIRTLLWIYCDLIVHQDQQPSSDIFSVACYLYNQLKGVPAIDSFAVDENHFVSGPGCKGKAEAPAVAGDTATSAPKPVVEVPMKAPPQYLQPSPLLELANSWAEKYNADSRDGEPGDGSSGSRSRGDGSGSDGAEGATHSNPCRASWLAHVRSATRQQQLAGQAPVASPDRRKEVRPGSSSAPAPAHNQPALVNTAGSGPAPAPRSAGPNPMPRGSAASAGMWHLMSSGVPGMAAAGHHFLPANYSLMSCHYQPKALGMAPGQMMPVGLHGTMPVGPPQPAATNQASTSQRNASTLTGVHHKTFSAMQQHHKLMAAVRQQQHLAALHHQLKLEGHVGMVDPYQVRQHLEDGLAQQQKWRRSQSEDGQQARGGAGAVVSPPRSSATRWAAAGICSPASGALLCDEDLLVASPALGQSPRRGLRGSPAAVKAASQPTSSASHASEGPDDASTEEVAQGTHEVKEILHAQQEGRNSGSGMSGRPRLADARGTHPVLRNFHDRPEQKRSRPVQPASAVEDGQQPQFLGWEPESEDMQIHQRKKMRSKEGIAEGVRSSRQRSSVAEGQVECSGARSGVDMLMALADAANTILCDEPSAHYEQWGRRAVAAGSGGEAGSGPVKDEEAAHSPRQAGEGSHHDTTVQLSLPEQQQAPAAKSVVTCPLQGQTAMPKLSCDMSHQDHHDNHASSHLESSSGVSEPMIVGPLAIVQAAEPLHRNSCNGQSKGEPGMGVCASGQRKQAMVLALATHQEDEDYAQQDLQGRQHMDLEDAAAAIAAAAAGTTTTASPCSSSPRLFEHPTDGVVNVAIHAKGQEAELQMCARLSGAGSKQGGGAVKGAPPSQPWLETLGHLATDPSCTAQERLQLMQAYMSMVQQGLAGRG